VESGHTTKTIGIVSLGCAKNLVNTEQMMFLLKEAGYIVTGETDGADAVIVNTCGFIDNAKMEAIDVILELDEERRFGKAGKIIVTGCFAERYKDELLTEMPEIDGVVGVGSFEEIVKVLNRIFESDEKVAMFGDIDAPISETKRVITTSNAWAYIKIAEGCDNRCAFCIIPSLRGRFRSRPMDKILGEAKELVQRGVREIILIAQDSTRYGLDLYGSRRLADLLTALSEIDNLKWIRLHYLYPDDITEELIDVIANNEKILKYMDIPIQHINDTVLQKMNRRGNSRQVRQLLRRLRERIAGVVIRTSIIAGLPGEGDKEFEELYEFLKSEKIERAGVFRYSPEEGTTAAVMTFPDTELAEKRTEALMQLQAHIIDEFNKSRIGSTTTVLIEGVNDGSHFGRSFAESPDVDGYINVIGEGIKIGQFYNIKITDVIDGEPIGETI